MKRSSWKIPIVSNCFLRSNILDNLIWEDIVRNENHFKRNYMIPNTLVDKEIWVHNGLQFGILQVKKNAIGHKLGEFSITKVLSQEIAERKRKKVGKKRKKKIMGHLINPTSMRIGYFSS